MVTRRLFESQEMKKEDLVVVDDGKSTALVRVTTVGKDCSGVMEKTRHDNPRSIDFAPDQVLVNLGPQPKFGTVYGCKVEWLHETRQTDEWGPIHFFRDTTGKERKAVRQVLDGQLALRKKLGLPVPDYMASVHVREKSGKWAGTYAYRPRNKEGDIITLRPSSFTEPTEQQSVVKPSRWLDYVVAHEDAHGWWYRYCTAKVKARWIKAYHSLCVLSASEPDEVKSLGRDFLKTTATVRDYRTDLPEEHQALFDGCISWIVDYHSLSRDNIDTLLDVDRSSVKALWPTDKLFDTDTQIPLGEYASTSVEELFAEAFALRYATGMKLPKQFENLMAKTITFLARTAKNVTYEE